MYNCNGSPNWPGNRNIEYNDFRVKTLHIKIRVGWTFKKKKYR
jgi:hypothetical protein